MPCVKNGMWLWIPRLDSYWFSFWGLSGGAGTRVVSTLGRVCRTLKLTSVASVPGCMIVGLCCRATRSNEGKGRGFRWESRPFRMISTSLLSKNAFRHPEDRLCSLLRLRLSPDLAGAKHGQHDPSKIVGRCHQGDLPAVSVSLFDSFEAK